MPGDRPPRERPHRLSDERYLGQISVALTCCVQHRRKLFTAPQVVSVFHEMLISATEREQTVVALYCFMPDHLHLILTGQTASARPLKAADRFKQLTGFWLAQNGSAFRWQKGFYDHIIRSEEEFWDQVYYVLNNPIRAGLVEEWPQYPFIGSSLWTIEELVG